MRLMHLSSMFRLFLHIRIQIFLTLLAGVVVIVQAQTTSWRGTTSTAWATSANWTNGVPSATVNAIIGDASFTGNNQPSITGTATAKSLTIGGGAKACTLSISRTFTVSGNVIINSNGRISHTTNSTFRPFTLSGNWTNSGSYAATGGNTLVTFAGTAQTIGGTSVTVFQRLTINGGCTVTLSQNVTESSAFTLSGTLNPNGSYKITNTGATTFNSGAVFQVQASTFVGAAGNLSNNPTTLNSGCTVTYMAASQNQFVNALTYRNLIFNNPRTCTLSGNTTVNASNVTVNAGTLDLSTYTLDRSAAGGTFTLAAGATVRIGGTGDFPANYNTNTLNSTSTVEYYGTNQTVTNRSYGNLIISGTGTKTTTATAFTIAGNLSVRSANFTAAANLTINGFDSIASGATFTPGSFSHTLAGNLVNNGTLSPSTGTITVSGGNTFITGGGAFSFNNLSISGVNVSLNPSAGVTITGNLSISGSGFLVQTSSLVSVAGNISTTGAGTLTATAGTISTSGNPTRISGGGISLNNFTVASGLDSTSSTFTVAGNFTANGTFTANSGIITLSGASKTVSGTGAITFSKLTVSGSLTCSSSFTLNSDLSITGSLTASSGTATFAGTSTLSGIANLNNVTLSGTKLQLGANAVLGVAGTLTLASGTFDLTTTTPNTVSFNGPGAQNINSTTYFDLTLSGGGVKTAAGALTLNRDLTIASTSATFNAGSFTHAIFRNIANSGTLNPGTSDIRLVGGSDASISGTTTFNTLTVNKSSAGNVVALNSDITVSNIAMTQGSLLTGTHSITITGDRTGPSIILGTIVRTNPFTTGTAYAFESPNNSISFSAITGAISSITVTILSAPVTDFPFDASINREYDITVAGGATYSAALRLHYQDAELNGNTESLLGLWHYAGSAWYDSSKTANDTVDNWVEKSGFENLNGRWSCSDKINVLRWIGTSGSDWNNSANWTSALGTPNMTPDYTTIVILGDSVFSGSQPSISSNSTIRSMIFGGVQAVTLSIASGTLTINGNVEALWNGGTLAAPHALNVGSNALVVGGSLVLSDDTIGHSLNLAVGSGSVTVDGSITQTGDASVAIGSGSLFIGGDFIRQSSSPFSAGSSTVTYNGSSAQEIGGNSISYNNLVFDKSSGTATLSSPAMVSGNLTLAASGVYLDVNATLTIGGTIAINSGATFDASSATINVGGNWSNNGTFISDSGIVVFDGMSAQTISSSIFNDLTINTANVVSPTGNIQINGNLSVIGGTLDLASYTANRSVFGGSLSVGSSAVLKVGGAGNFPSNYASNVLATTSTVEYNGTGAQIISAISYGNLVLSGSAKGLTGSTAINGNLQINAGVPVNAGPYSLSLAGNWTNNGSFSPSTSTVTMAGSGKTLTGQTSFFNLNVTGYYTFASNSTVIGTLNITDTLDAAGSTITIEGDFVNSGLLLSSGTAIFPGTTPQTLVLNSGFRSIGSVLLNGTFPLTLSSSSSPSFQNVTINNTIGISPNVGWAVNGTFTVGGGATFAGGDLTHTFLGSFTNYGTITSNGVLFFSPSGPATVQLLGTAFSDSGTVNFGGSGSIALSGASPIAFNDLIISNTSASGITPQSNWTVNGTIEIQPGAVFHGDDGGSGRSHTFAGDVAINGTFDGAASTVTFNDPVNANMTLSVSGSATFNNLVIGASDSLTTLSNIAIQGNLTNGGTFINEGAIVTFSGSSNSTIGGATNPQLFDQLVVAKAGAAGVQLSVAVDSLSALTVTGGTLDANGRQIVQQSAGGIFALSAGATFKTGGTTIAFPAFIAYNFDSLSTVEYNGSGNQTVISSADYGNLVLSTGGTKSANGALIIAGALSVSNATFTPNSFSHGIGGSFSISNGIISTSNSTVFTVGGDYSQSGGTFNGGTNEILAIEGNFSLSGGGVFIAGPNADTVGGNWTMSGGTFTNAGSTIVFNGNAAQTISSSGSFNAIDVVKPSGSLTLSGTVSTTTLNLIAGKIATGTDTLIIASGGSVVGANANRYVVGYLQKTFSAAAPNQNFEIGEAAFYAPDSLSFAGVVGSVVVTCGTLAGDHPSIGTSGILTNKSVNRYWRLSRSGGSFASYSAVFNFNPADVDAGSNVSNFSVKRYAASSWDTTIVGIRAPVSTQATGLTSFGDFQIGEVGKYWSGPANGNWGTPANWNPAGVPTATDHIVLNGADTLQIDVAAVCNDFSMTSSAARVTILPAQSLTTSAFFAISAGTFITQNAFPSAGGSITLNGGTFGYDGSGAQTVAALRYNDLSVTGSRGGNSITFSSSDTIHIAGIFNPAATFTSGSYIVSNTIFMFDGASAQTVPGFAYNRLVISGGTKKNAGGDIMVTRSLATLSSADTLDFASHAFIAAGVTFANAGVLMTQDSVALGSGAIINGTFIYEATSASQTIADATYTGTLIFGGAAQKSIGNILIGNSFTATGGARIYAGCVTYNRAGSQAIAAESYRRLTLAGSGTKIFNGSTSIADTLRAFVPVTIAGGTTSLGANGVALFSDSLTVDGVFDAAAGSNAVVIFDGGAQVITGSSSGISFRNLVLSGSAAKFSSVPLTISGTFTPNRGITLGAADTLCITNNSSGAVAPFGAGEEVIGCLQRAVTTAGMYRLNNDSTSVTFTGGAPSTFALRVDSCTNPYGYTTANHVNRRIYADYAGWTSGKANLKIGYRFCERPSQNENMLRMLKSDGVADSKKMVTGISTVRAPSTSTAFGSVTLAGISPGGGFGADSLLPNGAQIVLSNAGASFLSIANADWNLGSTWDEGTVPTSDDDVTIGHTVSIFSAASAASVTINGGKTLTLANGNLTVRQGLVNSAGASIAVASGRRLQVAASGTGPLYNLGSIINRGTIITNDADSLGQIDNSGGVLRLRSLNAGKPDTIQGSVELYGNNQSIPAKLYRHLVLSGSGTDSTMGGSFTVSGNLTIAQTASLSVQDGSTLTLGDTLFEQGYLRGKIRKSQLLGSSAGTSDFGRIGATLTWMNRSPDTTFVTRTSGIASSGNGRQSILRYYDIAPKENSRLGATLIFKYSTNELGSHLPKALELWRSTDNGTSWRRQGGVVDTLQRTVTKPGISEFSRWTVSDTSHLLGPSAYEWMPDSLFLARGNNQIAYRRTPLQPFVVRVKDFFGNWLERDTVAFEIVGNTYGAILSTLRAITDSNGYASAVLTLGDSLGTYTVMASNPVNRNRAVIFSATAVLSRTASAVRLASGNNQPPAPILTPLSRFVVSVLDSSSNPVAGVPVRFAIDSLPARATGQSLSDTIANTDLVGQASSILTLGNKVGAYRIRASVSGLTGSPVTFIGRAVAGQPNASVLVSGDNQIKQIGDTLDQPIVISVADVGTNPVSGVKVAFAVTSAPSGARNSSLTADSAYTDSLGRVSVRFIIGTEPGYYDVTASVPGLQPIVCTARGFFLSGDANSDEALNVADITTIIDRLNGRRALSELDSIRADVDTNNIVDVHDIAVIDSCILNEVVYSDSGATMQSKYAPVIQPVSHASVAAVASMNEVSTAQAASVSGGLEVTVNGLRLNLSNGLPVTGIQLDARFRQNISVEAPELIFERMRGMQVRVHSNGTKLHILAYNLANIPLAPFDSTHSSSNTLLRLPLILSGIAQIDTAQMVVSTVNNQAISFPVVKSFAVPGLSYPAYYKLYQNYPNPFNGKTTIRFEVPDLQGKFARVSIQIFDILGREVKTLFLGDVEAGVHPVLWDGKDHSGQPMPSGIYFCRLLAREHLSVKKIIYIK